MTQTSDESRPQVAQGAAGQEEQTFFGRWSRRKRGIIEEPAEETIQDDEVAHPDDDLDDAALCEKYALPDPDTLKPGDSIKGFMQKQIPSRLRNRALRKLWISNPVLANLDELIDYGEDYTDAATVIENMATVYQVGRGMLRDVVANPEESSTATPEVADDDTSEDTATEFATETQTDDAMPVTDEPVTADIETSPQELTDQTEMPVVQRKRMAFVFADEGSTRGGQS